MTNLSNKDIRELAAKSVSSLLDSSPEILLESLKPILNSKCSFYKLDLLGELIGYELKEDLDKLINGFDALIKYNKMGSYVICSKGLTQLLPNNLGLVMEKSRDYIIFGDTWYVCDIVGERSIGQSLVDYFDLTLPWIKKFLDDKNKWIKRSAGVSMHFFTKRTKNEKEKTILLLNTLEPYIEEKNIDIVKGIGWGLKTIGRYYPELLTSFMQEQLSKKRKISRVIIRKSLTYLPIENKLEIEKLV